MIVSGAIPQPASPRSNVQGFRGWPATAKTRVRNAFGGMESTPSQFGAPAPWRFAAAGDRPDRDGFLAGTSNIREVILFPMNQRAEDLMMSAPSEPTSDQLMELGLRVIPQD